MMWTGSEAIVMPGVTIGDSATIGTRALVTKDVEPYAIVGDNPAGVIRKRIIHLRKKGSEAAGYAPNRGTTN